jgi:hypothetical protein
MDEPCAYLSSLFFQFAHHLISAVLVHHASNTKRRHDPTHARKTAGKPVHSDLGEALLERRAAVAIVQVEAHEMERRRDELDRSRREELRRRSAGHVALHPLRQWERRRDHRRQVERREDREAVARGEQGVGDWRDRARRYGAEDLGELAVLVETQAQVGGACCDEFRCSARDGCGRLVLDCGFKCVQGVGHQVCAAVEGEDEGERFGSEELVRSEQEGTEGCLQGGNHGTFARCILDDSSALLLVSLVLEQ